MRNSPISASGEAKEIGQQARVGNESEFGFCAGLKATEQALHFTYRTGTNILCKIPFLTWWMTRSTLRSGPHPFSVV